MSESKTENEKQKEGLADKSSLSDVVSNAAPETKYSERELHYLRNPVYQPHSDIGEQMALRIMHQGHATADEILKASFGGDWPPNGLNILLDNPQSIDIRDIADTHRNRDNLPPDEFKRDPDTPNGNATHVAERVIGLNDFSLFDEHREYGYSSINSVLGHEGVHILQGDHYHRSRDTYGVHEVQMPYQERAQNISARDIVGDFFDKYMTEEELNGPNDDGYKYHADGAEIQSRLHQIMMAGYKETGCLPANKTELMATMSKNFLMPNEIEKPLWVDRTALDKFSGFSFSNDFYPIQDIESVLKRLSYEDEFTFFDKIVPELYSDLIEMYGDKEGRARFDLGENHRYVYRASATSYAYSDALKENSEKIQALSGGEVKPDHPKGEQSRAKATEMIEAGKITELREEINRVQLHNEAMDRIEFAIAHDEPRNKAQYDEFDKVYTESGFKGFLRAFYGEEEGRAQYELGTGEIYENRVNEIGKEYARLRGVEEGLTSDISNKTGKTPIEAKTMARIKATNMIKRGELLGVREEIKEMEARNEAMERFRDYVIDDEIAGKESLEKFEDLYKKGGIAEIDRHLKAEGFDPEYAKLMKSVNLDDINLDGINLDFDDTKPIIDVKGIMAGLNLEPEDLNTGRRQPPPAPQLDAELQRPNVKKAPASTILYHATPAQELIDKIDLDVARGTTANSKTLGEGFYTSQHEGFSYQQGLLQSGHKGGLMYKMSIPQNIIHNSLVTNQNGERFLNSSQGTTTELVERVARAVESFGTQNGHDFTQDAEEIRKSHQKSLEFQLRRRKEDLDFEERELNKAKESKSAADIEFQQKKYDKALEEYGELKKGTIPHYPATDIVKPIQYKYADGKHGVNTYDILERANIDFLIVDGSNMIFVNQHSLPEITPYSCRGHSLSANLLDDMNDMDLGLPDEVDRRVRQNAVRAGMAENNLDPKAFDIFDDIRKDLQAHVPEDKLPQILEKLDNRKSQVASALELAESQKKDLKDQEPPADKVKADHAQAPKPKVPEPVIAIAPDNTKPKAEKTPEPITAEPPKQEKIDQPTKMPLEQHNQLLDVAHNLINERRLLAESLYEIEHGNLDGFEFDVEKSINLFMYSNATLDNFQENLEGHKKEISDVAQQRQLLTEYKESYTKFHNTLNEITGAEPRRNLGGAIVYSFRYAQGDGGVDQIQKRIDGFKISPEDLKVYMKAEEAIRIDNRSSNATDPNRPTSTDPTEMRNSILGYDSDGISKKIDDTIAEYNKRFPDKEPLSRASAASNPNSVTTEAESTKPEVDASSEEASSNAGKSEAEATQTPQEPPPADVEQEKAPNLNVEPEQADVPEKPGKSKQAPAEPRPVDAPTGKAAGASAGVGAAGLAMGAVGLKTAISEGDKTGIAVSGADVGISSVDLGLDVARAAGKHVPNVLSKLATKANVIVMVADGAYQISREKTVGAKLARAGAVTATTGAAVGVGAVAGTVAATGVAATAATVAAPVAAAVAVGVAADAGVEAYKAGQEKEASIARGETAVKDNTATEESGAPKLTNYKNLKVFAMFKAKMPDGSEGLSRSEKAQLIKDFEYSKNPEALEELEKQLQDKLDHYDKIIEKNDSKLPDLARIFVPGGADKIDKRDHARIERMHYKAAMKELQQYKKELAEHKEKQQELTANKDKAPQEQKQETAENKTEQEPDNWDKAPPKEQCKKEFEVAATNPATTQAQHTPSPDNNLQNNTTACTV